jgi:hypothetical protein
MARIVELRWQIAAIVGEVFERAREANEARARENLAATAIQAWFRGTKVRAYLAHLSSRAKRIQQVWRGKLGRQVFRLFLDNKVRFMRQVFYNQRATLVLFISFYNLKSRKIK